MTYCVWQSLRLCPGFIHLRDLRQVKDSQISLIHRLNRPYDKLRLVPHDPVATPLRYNVNRSWQECGNLCMRIPPSF